MSIQFVLIFFTIYYILKLLVRTDSFHFILFGDSVKVNFLTKSSLSIQIHFQSFSFLVLFLLIFLSINILNVLHYCVTLLCNNHAYSFFSLFLSSQDPFHFKLSLENSRMTRGFKSFGKHISSISKILPKKMTIYLYSVSYILICE